MSGDLWGDDAVPRRIGVVGRLILGTISLLGIVGVMTAVLLVIAYYPAFVVGTIGAILCVMMIWSLGGMWR